MRKSKSLERIRNGEAMRVTALGHYIPAFVCHAARAGYDCIWLDLEHRALTLREVEAILAFGHLFDIDIMVRPPTLEQTGLYRFLEDGAAGLLIPFVSTPEKAKKLVDAVKFPPIGDRGLDNAGLDSDFHIHDIEEYAAWANRETFLVVQIETPEGVHNAEAIAAIEGVDMIFIGTGDLGFRLNLTGEMTLDEAWEIVANACKKHGKVFGGPTTPLPEMKKRHDQGARLLVNNGDYRNWANGLAENVKEFDELP